MLNLETRMHVKVLWLAGWLPREIANYLSLKVDEVQALIDIFERRFNNAALPRPDHCRFCDHGKG